jgi:hypothetical protein
VLPTLVVLDSTGRVLAAEETDSYRLRPGPEAVLEILDGARARREQSIRRAPLAGVDGAGAGA